MIQLKITRTIMIPSIFGEPTIVFLDQDFFPVLIIRNIINVFFTASKSIIFANRGRSKSADQAPMSEDDERIELIRKRKRNQIDGPKRKKTKPNIASQCPNCLVKATIRKKRPPLEVMICDSCDLPVPFCEPLLECTLKCENKDLFTPALCTVLIGFPYSASFSP